MGALLRSHFFLLLVYSTLVSLFFALLYRQGRRPVFRFFSLLFAWMVGGVIAVAWIMYFFQK